jgi:hypothetical protein
MTFAGTRCRTTREIHIRVTIVTITVMAGIIVMIVRDTVGQVDGATAGMMDHGVALRVYRAGTLVIPGAVDVRSRKPLHAT